MHDGASCAQMILSILICLVALAVPECVSLVFAQPSTMEGVAIVHHELVLTSNEYTDNIVRFIVLCYS